ncbi:MAG: metal-dependent hydrolase [Candidatus Omnitrophica bacterium]|nr:metal-dependent hydrolase [Candidatus Omnitrophota bacterium]
MIAPTHIAFAVLSVSLLGAIVNVVILPLALSFACLGSLFPDIDTTASFIGRIFSPLALFLERRFGHRTITHSLLGTIIFAIIFIPLVFLRNKLFFVCLILGYLSHILIDCLNKSGVPLFYPNLTRAVIPGNEKFRISVASREELIFLGILITFATFVIPLNRIGLRGALHYLVRIPQSAVTDYLNYSAEGRQVIIEFDGVFNVSQKRINGRWEAIGSTSKNSLIIKSPEGKIYSIGANPGDNIRSLSIRSHKAGKLKTQSREIYLRNQLLLDIFQYIPKEGESYLLGYIKTYDKPKPRFSVDEFNTLKVGVNRLDFLYATKQDILKQNLSHILVLEGQILIRTLYKDNELPKPISAVLPTLEPSATQVVTLYIKDIYNLEDELKVKPKMSIKKGSLLASLNQKRDSLLLERQRAQERLNLAEIEFKTKSAEIQNLLKLKEKENQILKIKRPLESLRQEYDTEFSRLKSNINLAKLSLAKIEKSLKATQIYSPVEGEILSIQVQHTTVTLRILVKNLDFINSPDSIDTYSLDPQEKQDDEDDSKRD